MLYAAVGIGQLSASAFISKLKEENIVDKQSQESLNKALEKSKEKYGKIDAFVNSSYPFGKNWGKTPCFLKNFTNS